MPATDLIISEYVEGSSNNKALEIYNGTGEAIDLSQYQIVMYFNGSTTAGLTITLSGIVQPGDVFILAQSSANALILAQADQTNGAGWFNGDDAIVLRRTNGTVVDSIGQIGFDPGTEWGSGLLSTADNTLRRDSSVITGDTNPSDAFTLSGWTGYANDTFGGLGTHSTTPAYTIVPLAGDRLEGDSGTTSFTFTVTRPDATLAENVAWSVSVPGGSPVDADANDFIGNAYPSGTIAFLAGETSRTLTISVAGDLLTEVDETFTVTLGVTGSPSATGTIRNDDILLTEIADIQGAGHVSPLVGQTVATVGIVTAITGNGFWIQDATPDSDSRTSDAVFVFTSSAPAAGIVVGAEVRVSGRVTEFYPDSGSTAELSLTEISIGTTGFVQLTGNTGIIAPTVVGVGGLLPPTDSYGDDDNVFDPATEGLDFWESLEGMLVTLNNVTATGPSDTNGFNDTEVFATLEGIDAGLRTPNDGLIVREGDFNPERIAIQEDNRTLNNDFTANVGDSLGNVTGVVNYTSGGYYEVLATSPFTVTPGSTVRETSTTLAAASDQLTIASYNAENLALNNPALKFMDIAEQIVNGLLSPDIIALQEVQDDTGSTNNGVTTSNATLDRLIAAIVEAGGPQYAYAYVTPQNNEDGGQTGGNIRQVFLYNPERVQLADNGSVGDYDDAVSVGVDGNEADLSLSVGRIDPGNIAFDNSRKPLVAEFIFNGERVFVINNHFNSKIGDDPLFGTNQPPVEETEAQRIAQAQVVAAFIAELLAADPDANIAVVGDLNDFGFSDALQVLEDAGLSNLNLLLPENERYDYVFQGNSQQLDHILTSDNLGEDAAFDILRINAEFYDQTSDHDPLVARLNIAAGLTIDGGNGADVIDGGVGNDTLSGNNGNDIISGGNGKDLIRGGRGDDVLIGGAAGDELYGDQGNDVIDGGSGNDFIVGGQGNDWMTGGSGADLFQFGRSSGHDTITDFEDGIDTLDFIDGVSLVSHSFADANGDGAEDTILLLSTGATITLLGDAPAPLALAPLATAEWQVNRVDLWLA